MGPVSVPSRFCSVRRRRPTWSIVVVILLRCLSRQVSRPLGSCTHGAWTYSVWTDIQIASNYLAHSVRPRTVPDKEAATALSAPRTPVPIRGARTCRLGCSTPATIRLDTRHKVLWVMPRSDRRPLRVEIGRHVLWLGRAKVMGIWTWVWPVR